MTRVSATASDHATERMTAYNTAFAMGGFGWIVIEGIYRDEAFSQGYLHQPGLAPGSQEGAWRPVVNAVHAAGGHIFAQLMHAGALSQCNPHSTGTRGPSGMRLKGTQMTFYRIHLARAAVGCGQAAAAVF
jgi:2,4-dienoyl-CoA reductase-like NADH-dependent reductase (Old Yellow Enzyme family)